MCSVSFLRSFCLFNVYQYLLLLAVKEFSVITSVQNTVAVTEIRSHIFPLRNDCVSVQIYALSRAGELRIPYSSTKMGQELSWVNF